MEGSSLHIFFDIDGTLGDHESAATIACRELRQRHDHFMTMMEGEFHTLWFLLIDQRMRLTRSCSFKQESLHFTREIFSRFGRMISDEDAATEFDAYMRAYSQNWQPYADVRICFDALAGCKLGIISNGDGEYQLSKLDRMGLAESFKPIVLSADFGKSKPDLDIFHEARRLSGQSVNNCVYVGDDLETDVVSSISAGWRAVWLNRNRRNKQIENVISITSLVELPAIIAKLHPEVP